MSEPGTSDLREFLRTRRARISPKEVGLPPQLGRRRVPGLRREEVALLAGISSEYYERFEAFNPVGDASIVLGIHTVEPNSASQNALRLLGSWTAADLARPEPRPL
jgi:hypothetical protein